MRVIELNKGKKLQLPETWEDLTHKQVIYAFGLLLRMFANEITPFQFQLLMLIKITGYKPRRYSIVRRFFRWMWIITRKGSRFYKDLKSSEEEIKENIGFNLIQLAETIDFAFTLEENKIITKFDFKRNPFEYLSDTPPYFNRNYVVETNLTARQFSDALDLIIALEQTDDETAKNVLIDKIIYILYFGNIRLEKLSYAVKFGILSWFRSVADFFRHHPTFCVLYPSQGDDSDDDEKISLGLTEVILFLKKSGYADSADMNLIDFFNAQIKSLKDKISEALASGIKEDELSQKTGLDPWVIHKLS